MMVINLPHTRRSIDSESSSIGPRSVGGWVVCGWFGGRSAAGWRRRGLLVPSGPRARAEPCRGPAAAGLADRPRRPLSSLVPSRLVRRPGSLCVVVGWFGGGLGPAADWLAGTFIRLWRGCVRRGLAGWLSGAGRASAPAARPLPAAAAGRRGGDKKGERERPDCNSGTVDCGIYMRGEDGGLRDVWVSWAGGARSCVRAARARGRARAPTRGRHLCTPPSPWPPPHARARTPCPASGPPPPRAASGISTGWPARVRARGRCNFEGPVGAGGGGGGGARARTSATAPGAWPSRAGERHRCRVAARHAGRAPEARKKETRRAW